MKYTIKKGLATLISLENSSLEEFNRQNGTKRAKLTFSYVTESKGSSGLDDLLQSCSTEGSTYSVIIELSGLKEEELQKLKNAVSNKEQANFSTVICSISQLTGNKFTVVNNGKRDYSTLSNSYLGLRDEGFLKESAEALKNRLYRQVEDNENEMEFGSVRDTPKETKPTLTL